MLRRMWTGKPIIERTLHSAVLAVLVVKPWAEWWLFGGIYSDIWHNRVLRLIKASPWAESTTEVCLGNSILDWAKPLTHPVDARRAVAIAEVTITRLRVATVRDVILGLVVIDLTEAILRLGVIDLRKAILWIAFLREAFLREASLRKAVLHVAKIDHWVAVVLLMEVHGTLLWSIVKGLVSLVVAVDFAS